jgi:hypothetical protein
MLKGITCNSATVVAMLPSLQAELLGQVNWEIDHVGRLA